MDILTLIITMMRDGTLARLAANPLAQFGQPTRRYLGAELLPEQMVTDNMFTEDAIRYRTVIANAGTRYSPAQKKGSSLVGSFDVKLADSDIAAEFSGRDYDALLRMLGRNASMDAVAQITRWADTAINLALIELDEVYRWQAIIDAVVKLRGDNGYKEDVALSNPSGHRLTVAGDWSNDSYDPFDDIYAAIDILAAKGYSVNRIITRGTVTTKLSRNAKAAARASRLAVSGGTIQTVPRSSLAAINSVLGEDGHPAIERYDLRYRTQNGEYPFVSDDAMVFIATTGRDATIDVPDSDPVPLTNTLGYTAIGRATGQATPGRVIRAEHKEDRPPRIEGEGWATSFPVITEPEAIVVLRGI